MSSPLTRERVRRDVEVLAHAGLDTATFLTEAYESLRRGVPSSAACVATVDPATQLTTGAFKFGDLADRYDTDELWGLLEYGHVEPTSFAQLVRAGRTAIGMLSSAGVDNRRSRRMHDLVRSALGCSDELRLVATADARMWGGAAIFRDDGGAYSDDDVAFMASLSGFVARGLRVGLLAGLADEVPACWDDGRPAVMLFDRQGRLQHASVGAEARLAQLVRGAHERAPAAILGSMVAATWRYAAGVSKVLPRSRLRLASGEWIVLHGSPMRATDGAVQTVVITIEEARPPEIVPLLVAVLDLTPREGHVTQLVLQGLATSEIAATLHISPHTVQDHLKEVFEKTGVSSRRDLVARVFFDQYLPRLGLPLSPSGGFLNRAPLPPRRP